MIFITGATGYTGQFVVNSLLDSGESVRCLVRDHRSARALEQQGVSLWEGDLEQPESLENALKGCSGVIQVAHIQYAQVMIDLCHLAGVKRAVFFSSTRRFSKVETSNVDVVVAGEDAVEKSGLDYTLLRPSMIYGPGNDRNISRLYAFVNHHRLMPIFGTGMNLIQPVNVEDVATAASGALWRTGAIGKAYTLAGPEAMPYAHMIDVLAQAAGRLILKVHIPISIALPLVGLGERLMASFPLESDQVKRMREDRSFDIADAKRELGFMPVRFEKGVAKAMKKWAV